MADILASMFYGSAKLWKRGGMNLKKNKKEKTTVYFNNQEGEVKGKGWELVIHSNVGGSGKHHSHWNKLNAEKDGKKIHDFTHVESKNVDLREAENSAYQETWWEEVGSGGGPGKLVLGSRSQKVATVVLVSNYTVGALQIQEYYILRSIWKRRFQMFCIYTHTHTLMKRQVPHIDKNTVLYLIKVYDFYVSIKIFGIKGLWEWEWVSSLSLGLPCVRKEQGIHQKLG